MFEESWKDFSSSDRENFRNTVASLLSHTFILSRVWDSASGDALVNPEYNWALRNYEVLEEYLEYAGITLSRDTGYGVIYISSFPASERARFDKLTTLVCYVLRLVYMENREALSLSSVTVLTVGDLVDKMAMLGLMKNRFTKTQIKDSLRRLLRFRLIAKGSGDLDDKATRIVVLPSIAFAISDEKITSLARLARGSEEEEEENEDA